MLYGPIIAEWGAEVNHFAAGSDLGGGTNEGRLTPGEFSHLYT